MQFGVDIDTTGVDVFSGKVKERNIWGTCVEGVGWWWRSRKKDDNQPHTESRINYDAEVRKLPGAGGILKAVQG